MKIAFLHYSCGLINRGSEISTQILADYFAKKKHQVYIYQLGKPASFNNFKVKRIRLLLGPRDKKNTDLLGKILARFYLDYNSLLALFFSLKAAPSLINLKPDIIVPTNGFWQVAVSKIIKIFTNSKIVIIGRAGIGWTDKDNIRFKPDLFIALTQKACLWAKKINPKQKTIYIPNPIDIKAFLKNTGKVKISLKKPIILTVAALTAYKNIDKVILAVSELKNTSLLIVGKGELFGKLNQLGNQYLKNRFQILSFNYSQMASVYESCDLFVLVSGRQEAFGRVFLEAMAAGLLVVTTDTRSRKKITAKAGILVKSLDKKNLSQAIKKGLAMKGLINAEKQAKKFDINIIGPKYEKVFLKILKP